MSKLYSIVNKLSIPSLAEAWGLEIGEDPGRLAETLVWAALDGRFDAVAHEDGETKPGIVVRPNERRDSVNRWDSETLREWIRIVANALEIGFLDALSSVLPRIAITREACVDFAEATGLKPPSFWRRKPPSLPDQRWVSIRDLRTYLNKPDIRDLPRPDQEDSARRHFAPKRVTRQLFRDAAAEQPRKPGRKPTK